MGAEVRPRLTRIGPPLDHHAIVVRFDGILQSCGVTSATVRRRMTIGMITAAGWRQYCWWHNFNAIRVGGSWAGNWYIKATEEDPGDGSRVPDPSARWRAYVSWAAAVDDWQSVTAQPWRTARALLEREDVSDGDWWAAMGRDRWYTDTTHDPVAWGDSIGARVRRELAAATPAELTEARAIPVGRDASRGGWFGWLVLAALAGIVLLAAARR